MHHADASLICSNFTSTSLKLPSAGHAQRASRYAALLASQSDGDETENDKSERLADAVRGGGSSAGPSGAQHAARQEG